MAMNGAADEAGDMKQVAWSLHNGWLRASMENQMLLGEGAGYAVNVTINGQSFAAEASAQEISPTQAPVWEWRLVKAAGELLVRYERMAELGDNAWLISFVYTNLSGGVQDLTGASMKFIPAHPEGARQWEPHPFWMGEVGGGKDALLAYRATTDFYNVVKEGDMVCIYPGAAWRLQPGKKARIGQFAVWLEDGTAADFRPLAQQWYRTIGLVAPKSMPGWITESILYEASAGGHIDARFSDVGGFAAFEKQLPYLADLGITTLWLNSVHTHKTPPDAVQGNWNLYAPRDFDEIDPVLGGEEALDALAATARQHQIHLLGELVPHGYQAPQATELREWWTGRPDGEPTRDYDGAAMDYSSPKWQAVMQRCARRLSRQFGMEGVRIDVADGMGANWTSPRTNQASYSTLGGSLEMLEAIYDGMDVRNAVPMLIPESREDHPEYVRLAPISYGIPTTGLFAHGLPGDWNDAPAMNQRIRDFFENERGSLPEGMRIIRTLGNHDSVGEFGRPAFRFGAGLARAFWGVCLSVPGIPMFYQEDEIGSFDALRQIIWARRSIPEFSYGEPDYLGVHFDPAVFSVLRSTSTGHALGLANLSSHSVSGTVSLPPELALADGTRVYDGVSGNAGVIQKHAFAWTLKGYQTALLRIGAPPVAISVPEIRTADHVSLPDPVPFTVETQPASLAVRSGRLLATLLLDADGWQAAQQAPTETQYVSPRGEYQVRQESDGVRVALKLKTAGMNIIPALRFLNTSRWWVCSRTALLADRTLRRHYPFPTPEYRWDRTMPAGCLMTSGALYQNVQPSGRLWQSVVDPLHPEHPALCFADEEGKGILLTDIQTNAGNVVLTDRSDEEHAGPESLDLRFYHSDPDLSPKAKVFGLGQPWVMDTYTEPHTELLEISFHIQELTGDPQRLFDVEWLPREGGAEFERIGPRFDEFSEVSYPCLPGTIRWSNLAPVEGTYTISLMLRHSDADATSHNLADSYVVEFDGAALPLSWVSMGDLRYALGFFGEAQTPPVSLGGKKHTLSVTTQKPWCGIKKELRLKRIE